VPWFSPELEPLLAVVTATIDGDGRLLQANAGFRRLVGANGPDPIGTRVNRFFIQPAFSTLLNAPADASGLIHQGLLTLGEYDGITRTLSARITRHEGGLRLLAEYDIAELERLYATVLELNQDYAQAQLELAQINLKLQQREAQILELSLTDPLTGIGNRRRLDQALEAEINRTERSGQKLCALMADIDFFKKINDNYGHETGDVVLRAFAGLLRKQTRPTDILARYGGEEFVILMANCDLASAVALAERIRSTVAATGIEPLSAPITASFGVAELQKGETGDSLINRADEALYKAKQSGRNRVVSA
jgi:diguanylate cyclase (GGDEF)-like protein